MQKTGYSGFSGFKEGVPFLKNTPVFNRATVSLRYAKNTGGRENPGTRVRSETGVVSNLVLVHWDYDVGLDSPSLRLHNTPEGSFFIRYPGASRTRAALQVRR